MSEHSYANIFLGISIIYCCEFPAEFVLITPVCFGIIPLNSLKQHTASDKIKVLVRYIHFEFIIYDRQCKLSALQYS